MTHPNEPAPSAENSIRRYTLLSVFVTIFLDLVGFGMFIPILPALARSLNATDAQAAYLSTVFSIGTLLSVMVLGKISDSIGRRRILLATIALSIICQGLTGFAAELGGYAFLAVVRFCAGIAAGNISVAQAAIADITPAQERARSMVVIGIAFGAGFAVGPALGGLLTKLNPSEPILPIALAAVALNIINLLLVVFRFKETHHKFAPAELNALIAQAREGSSGFTKQGEGTLSQTTTLLQRPFLKTILLMQFIQVFGFVGVETILPLALADAYNLNQSLIFQAFLYLGVMVLLVNGGVSRPLLKRIGESWTLSLGQISLMIGIFLIPWLAPRTPGLYAALSFLSVGSALANPALSGLVSRMSPHNQQGLALGLAQSLSAGARILGPACMGLLYEKFNGAGSLYFSSGLLLLVTLIGMAGLRNIKEHLHAAQSSSSGSSGEKT